MVNFVLLLVLLSGAGLGILGATALLRLSRRVAVSISLGVAAVYTLVLIIQPELPWVATLAVLAAGCAFGFLLGQLLGSVGSVLTFLGTAAIVDLLSFSDGLTRQIFEAYQSGGSMVLRFLALFVEMGGQEYAVVGVSDIALVAAAYLGLRKATGARWTPALFLLGGLLGAFMVGIVRGGAAGIPFLAAGAVAFVFVHRWRSGGSQGATPARGGS
jgi:hypothetical protein